MTTPAWRVWNPEENLSFRQKYQLKDLLGSGSVATVRRATRLVDGQEVAVKCVQSLDEQVRACAVEEYELMRSLDHPRLVGAHAVFSSSTSVWICMALCEGGSLEQAVRLHGPRADSTQLTRQLLEGVSYLHTQRIVHRDINPANLLLNSDAQLQLADFHSAKRIDRASNDGVLPARKTLDFAAPELRFSCSWNESVDVWAAGLTAWFMIEGRLPFHTSTAAGLECLRAGRLLPLNWALVPADMRSFFEQSLAVDPSDRPAATELLKHPALAEPAKGEALQAADEPPLQHAADESPVQHAAEGAPFQQAVNEALLQHAADEAPFQHAADAAPVCIPQSLRKPLCVRRLHVTDEMKGRI